MNRKKLTRQQRNEFIRISDALCRGHYHAIYKRLGWEKPNSNFKCPNKTAHAAGDNNPSMSVDNITGQFNCFGCGFKGNLPSYWKEYLKGNSQYGDTYFDFMIYVNGFEAYTQLFSDTRKCEGVSNRNEQMKDKGNVDECIADQSTSLPIDILNRYVDNLLNDKTKLDYLFETRRITTEIVQKYKIGLDDYGRYVFPQIDINGNLINLKTYDPLNPKFKWLHLVKDQKTIVSPPQSLTNGRLVFFEGETDAYAAIAQDIPGAVTLGSAQNNNIDKYMSVEFAEKYLKCKEIIIVFDDDDAGRLGALKLALSLTKYTYKIKLISLRQTDTFPNGLEPQAVSMVNGHEKRTEKDFTDFLKKNGFSTESLQEFNNLVERTPYIHFLVHQTEGVGLVNNVFMALLRQKCLTQEKYLRLQRLYESLEKFDFNMETSSKFTISEIADIDINSIDTFLNDKISETTSTQASDPQDQRQILVFNDESTTVRTLFTEIVDVLLPTNRFFMFNNILVYINADKGMVPLDTSNFSGSMIQHADFATQNEVKDEVKTKNDIIPDKLVKTFLNNQSELSKFPRLKLYTKNPVFDDKLNFIAVPGYHSESKVYYDGETIIPDSLHTILDELLSEFCFAEDADKVNFIGALITLLIVTQYPGAHPMISINANKQGLGKTTLAEILAIVSDNEITSISYTPNDEEFEKQIATAVITNKNVILIDNVKKRKNSDNDIEISSAVLD